jgi:hypothetical protein
MICCFLPGQPSTLGDYFEMPVTLCERNQFITGYGSRARWNHDFDLIAVIAA